MASIYEAKFFKHTALLIDFLNHGPYHIYYFSASMT